MIALVLLQELHNVRMTLVHVLYHIFVHLIKKGLLGKIKNFVNNIILSFCLRNIKLKLNWVSLLFTLCKRDIFQSPSE